MSAFSAEAQGQRSLYFVNGWIDGLLIGGISILLFLAVKFAHLGEGTVNFAGLAAALVWVVNWPHFSATNYRLYQSRRNIRQYPFTAFLVPAIIAIAAVGSFESPDIVAPYFAKLFSIWSPYHFSAQTFGISLIYARRSGFRIEKWERFGLAGFVYGCYLTASSKAEVGNGTGSFYTIHYPALGIPLWVTNVVEVSMYAFGFLFLLLVARRIFKTRKGIPLIVFLPAISQYIWFIYGATVPDFQVFVPLFHSLQYLLIAWSMQLHLRAGTRPVPSASRFVITESARWGVVNFVGGALLFYLLPHFFGMLGWDLSFATAIILAAVQIHHFFVDGVIWKLKDKSVSSPLMKNFSEIFARSFVPAEAETVS